MSSVNKFFWFMRERLKIQAARESGKPPPWTKDPVLARYHFCNVFREDDRVSRYWHAHCKRYANGVSVSLLVTNTLMFRFFNLPSTWNAIEPSWKKWEPPALLDRLEHAPRPIFNSAYMVTGSTGTGQSKHVSVIQACDTLMKIPRALEEGVGSRTIEDFTRYLIAYPMVGRFMAYEVACDLTMCGLWLPEDIHTWANLGPGAARGLNRIHKRNVKTNVSQNAGLLEMRRLYEDAQQHAVKGTLTFPRPLNMRVIEHTLCEFDKYERAWNSGNARLRVYKPTED